MSVLQTALVFVGIPLGLASLIGAAVMGRSAVARDRYRPGRPWTYPAVWYVPHPDALPARPGAVRPAITAGTPATAAPATGTLGGASGEW